MQSYDLAASTPWTTRPFSNRRKFARGATFSVRLIKLNCFQLCCCTISAENDAPRAKFRLVENSLLLNIESRALSKPIRRKNIPIDYRSQLSVSVNVCCWLQPQKGRHTLKRSTRKHIITYFAYNSIYTCWTFQIDSSLPMLSPPWKIAYFVNQVLRKVMETAKNFLIQP